MTPVPHDRAASRHATSLTSSRRRVAWAARGRDRPRRRGPGVQPGVRLESPFVTVGRSRTTPNGYPDARVGRAGTRLLGTPFGPDFWGHALPATTPVNPNSAAYVQAILTSLRDGPPASREGYLETVGAPPLYVVPASQPYVPVLDWDPDTGRCGRTSTWTRACSPAGSRSRLGRSPRPTTPITR